MPILPLVVAQHAEEAAFLWLVRDVSVNAPHYKPWERSKLDDRVEAHIDGLRVAGDEGWKLAWQQAEELAGPGELFAVGVLAFESGDAKKIEQVLTLAITKPELSRAVASSLGWLTDTQANAQLKTLVIHQSPAVRRIGIAGYGIRRLNPGPALDKALNDADLDLRARALELVGEMAQVAYLPLLKKHLTIKHLPCRFQAARSLCLLANEPAAVAELLAIALTESGYRQRSAEIGIRRMDVPAAQKWIRVLTSVPGSERLVIQATAALGDPVSVPKLIDDMKQPALARLAGEAFTFITGAHLTDLDLDGDAPDGFEAGPNEDALDERVSMDPDDGLYFPNPEKVGRWWSANQSRFPKGVRHLAGKPITPEWAATVLQTERQRLRVAAAIELIMKNPKMPMVEVRARER